MKKAIIFLLIFISNTLFADLIKIALKENQINLNPIYNPNNDIVKLLYLGLFYKKDNDYIPALAKSYKISADKLSYTIELKSGLNFMKNNIFYSEFSAEDVKTTYDIIKNSLYNSSYEKLYKNILSIKVLDKYKIEFRLKKPDDDFISKLTLGIMSKDALIKYGLSWFNSDAIGLGSYHLKKLSAEQIVLVKNPNAIFKPRNDGVIFKLYQNDVQVKNALNNKLVDAGIINHKNIKNLDESIQILALKSSHSLALSLNNYDRKLRYALSQIICTQPIISHYSYLTKSEHTNTVCNKEAAKKQLNELGFYKDKKSIELNINKASAPSFYKKQNIPLKLDIYINYANKDYLEIAEQIAAELKDFGILSSVLLSSEESEGSRLVDIEYENDFNLIKTFSISKNKSQAKNLINEFVQNYYKEFQEQLKINQPYIFLADFVYFLAHSWQLSGIKAQNVGYNASGLYSQLINWSKID